MERGEGIFQSSSRRYISDKFRGNTVEGAQVVHLRSGRKLGTGGDATHKNPFHKYPYEGKPIAGNLHLVEGVVQVNRLALGRVEMDGLLDVDRTLCGIPRNF